MMPPGELFILVFREEQTGPSHKTFTSAGTLLRFVEEIEAAKPGYDTGPYDVYVVSFEEPAIATFDVESVRKAIRKAVKR